jgi:hypothetical protein
VQVQDCNKLVLSVTASSSGGSFIGAGISTIFSTSFLFDLKLAAMKKKK